MNSAVNENDRDDTDALSQRCMQYLLGELPAAESAEFEQQLSQSYKLNRELLVQSEILCSLTAPQSTLVAATATTYQGSIAWRVATVLVALAACLTIALVGSRIGPNGEQNIAGIATTGGDSASEEELLIAQAWATSRSLDDTAETPWSAQESDFDLSSADATDVDSVLSWMVVAVAAGADKEDSQSGTTSDG